VGGILYIISDIAKIPFDQYVKAVLPFLVPLLIALIIVTYVPWVTMWLPGLFGMGR
jgi:TRAP-type C4-dicarboxylate transport system permease large subunit